MMPTLQDSYEHEVSNPQPVAEWLHTAEAP